MTHNDLVFFRRFIQLDLLSFANLGFSYDKKASLFLLTKFVKQTIQLAGMINHIYLYKTNYW
jgi:hypothetical protein